MILNMQMPALNILDVAMSYYCAVYFGRVGLWVSKYAKVGSALVVVFITLMQWLNDSLYPKKNLAQCVNKDHG